VDDAAVVGVLEGQGELADEAGGEVRRLGLAIHGAIERAAGDVFEDAVGLAGVVADFIDLHDMGIGEAGSGFDFGAEAGELLGVGASGADHFDRDEALEGGLAGQIDDSHTAAAEDFKEFEAGEIG